jgi:catechol 2,3-dioxygenase-like lactoylglutathione lyase family enzyme
MMANQLVGIDQAVVGVRDLERARASYERLGFRPTPLARHAAAGTANHCLVFPSDSVVLLGVNESSDQTADLERWLEQGEALRTLGLRTTDPDATRAAWSVAGLAPSTVAEHGWQLESGVEMVFRNVTLGAEVTGGVPIFACSRPSPDALREPAWLSHPNGAFGIASITVAVDDPAAYVEPMSKVFGATSLTETDDTLAVHGGGGVLLFATPDDLDMLHPELEGVENVSPPAISVLSVRVRHLDAAAAWLDDSGVRYRRDASGTIGIPPQETHGVMLELAAI